MTPTEAAAKTREHDAEGITLLGNQHASYPNDYDPSVLETFENAHQDLSLIHISEPTRP